MEKTRVKKGEKYWEYCLLEDMILQVQDRYDETSNYDFKLGNYFHTPEEAESMANKLRAVLKGAEVVEMPSDEEIAAYLDERNICPKSLEADSVREGIYFVKSKIVK